MKWKAGDKVLQQNLERHNRLSSVQEAPFIYIRKVEAKTCEETEKYTLEHESNTRAMNRWS